MSPGVARIYLNKTVKKFEKYAKTEYLSGLESGKADAATVLGAVRFVQTRNIKDHEPALRELFTDPPRGELHHQIAKACLDTLISTGDSNASTARFLAAVATSMPSLPTSVLAEGGLWRLRTESEEALLVQLTRAYDGRRLKKIARLLARLSEVRSPEPFAFWQEADAAERTSAADAWRERIRRARSAKGG